MTDGVRHVCVCGHVQHRLYDAQGVLMPTGAEGVSIPAGIDIHSSVGDVVVCCKIPCNHEAAIRPPSTVRFALLTVCGGVCVGRGA